MDTHVKVLGALQIAMGSMSLFAAFVLMLVFAGGFSAASLSNNPDAAIALQAVEDEFDHLRSEAERHLVGDHCFGREDECASERHASIP